MYVLHCKTLKMENLNLCLFDINAQYHCFLLKSVWLIAISLPLIKVLNLLCVRSDGRFYVMCYGETKTTKKKFELFLLQKNNKQRVLRADIQICFIIRFGKSDPKLKTFQFDHHWSLTSDSSVYYISEKKNIQVVCGYKVVSAKSFQYSSIHMRNEQVACIETTRNNYHSC